MFEFIVRRLLLLSVVLLAATVLTGCYGWGPHHNGWSGHHNDRGGMHGPYDNDPPPRNPDAPKQGPRCDDDPDTPAPPCRKS
jgi:hypothetical protein